MHTQDGQWADDAVCGCLSLEKSAVISNVYLYAWEHYMCVSRYTVEITTDFSENKTLSYSLYIYTYIDKYMYVYLYSCIYIFYLYNTFN